MEAHSKKSSGLNLNPIAPAQSKRTFPFSGKTQNSIENDPTFFEPFAEKSQKGSRVRPKHLNAKP